MITRFKADICALQEVDFYQVHWSEFMGRTFDGCEFAEKSGKSNEGLLTGWSGNVKMLEYQTVDLSPTMQSLIDAGAKGNIAQMFLFKQVSHDHHHKFVFINTHLYWAPGHDSLRRDQVAYLVKIYQEKYFDLPLVLAGDLNSDPQSECCLYLQSLGCMSLCRNLPFTVYCPGVFVDTLDYIWLYTGNQSSPSFKEIVLVDAEKVISDEEGGIPNIAHPSDHLPIGAEILHF